MREKQREERSNHMYSAMIFSVDSERLRLTRSASRDIAASERGIGKKLYSVFREDDRYNFSPESVYRAIFRFFFQIITVNTILVNW